MRSILLISTALTAGLFAGAAWAEPSQDETVLVRPVTVNAPNDPLEPLNRQFFRLDKVVSHLFGGRTVIGGAGAIPKPIRSGLYNFFSNLDEPATFANDVLQLKFGRASEAAGRFVANTTVGVFGVMDVASKVGWKRHREDFGQTLGRMGVKPGPYVYLPLSGPTTLRDAVGQSVDALASPGHWVTIGGGFFAHKGISMVHNAVQPSTINIREQARTEVREGQSTDEYRTLRGLYTDQRDAQIADLPNLADDPIPLGAEAGRVAPALQPSEPPRRAKPATRGEDASAQAAPLPIDVERQALDDAVPPPPPPPQG